MLSRLIARFTRVFGCAINAANIIVEPHISTARHGCTVISRYSFSAFIYTQR